MTLGATTHKSPVLRPIGISRRRRRPAFYTFVDAAGKWRLWSTARCYAALMWTLERVRTKNVGLLYNCKMPCHALLYAVRRIRVFLLPTHLTLYASIDSPSLSFLQFSRLHVSPRHLSPSCIACASERQSPCIEARSHCRDRTQLDWTIVVPNVSGENKVR